MILPLVILHSCIEGEEEIWIDGDGSGKLRAHYRIPSIALKQLGEPEDFIRAIKLVDEAEEGIEVQNVTFEIIKGKGVFHLEATFENALDLLEISDRNRSVFVEEAEADPEQLDALTGDINMGIEGIHVNFTRAVSLGPVFPSMVQRSPTMLGPSAFSYTIHFPAEVIETNAPNISEDRRTVSWEFLLKNYVDQPMLMTAKTKLPIPWWAWAVLAALLLMFAGLIWKLIHRHH